MPMKLADISITIVIESAKQLNMQLLKEHIKIRQPMEPHGGCDITVQIPHTAFVSAQMER
jgi:hypothetical protein